MKTLTQLSFPIILLCILTMCSINLTAQNVGINTLTPLMPLHVKSLTSEMEVLRLESANASGSFLSIWNNTERKGFLGIVNNENDIKLGTYATGGKIQFMTEVTNPAMTILSNGNVGIGTTSPGRKLEVSGEVNFLSTSPNPFTMKSSSNFSYMYVGNSDGTQGYMGTYNGLKDMDFGTASINQTGKTHLVTRAIPRLTVDENGQVGIGTETPNTLLDVDGAVSIGNSTGSNPTVGTIQWNGTDFEGYTGTGWKSLTKSVTPTQSLYVGISDFNASCNNGNLYSPLIGQGGSYISPSTSGGGSQNFILIPINLPRNSTITNIDIRFFDNSSVHNLEFVLYSHESNLQAYNSTKYTSIGTNSSNQIATNFLSNSFTLSEKEWFIRCYAVSDSSNPNPPVWGNGSLKVVNAIIDYTLP